jgi:GT2 family glycosyltransferase
MHNLAVVILNYNGRHHLERFLPSVIAHTPYPIIVADNDSTDDSLVLLKEQFPQVQLLILDKNYGFAEGYNRALAQLSCDFAILLNSDVEVSPGWSDNLLKALLADESIVAVQPKILSAVDPSYFDYAGAAGGYIDRFGYPYCRGRIFDTIEQDHGQYNDACQVFWTSGACMIVRMKAFNEAGGFRSEYFAHMEEIDLCWRLQRMGYQLRYEPSSVVYHLGGGTLAMESPFKTFLNFRNSLLTLWHNTIGIHAFLLVFARLCLDFPAFVRFLLLRKSRNAFAILKAHFSFYRLILFGNNKFQKNLKIEQHVLKNKPFLVWQYFILGKRKFYQLEDQKY